MTGSPRQGRVLVIGHSCLDSIAVLNESAPPDGKLEAERIWVGAGGPAANAAIAMRRLGHTVRLATRFGDDAPGMMVRSRLLAEGVQLLEEPEVAGITSLAQVRAHGPRRSVVWRRGRLSPLGHSEEVVGAWLDGVDLLYVDGHEVAAASTALALAGRAAIAALADAGSLRPGAADWPGQLDSMVTTPRWLAARFPEAASLEAAVEMLSAMARPGATVGVTMGERGGLARVGRETLTWRARKTGAVDTTAAGDMFHAGLADALLQGFGHRAALDWAATLAAAVCRAPGNEALPRDRAQLELWHGRWGHRPEADPELYRLSPATA